jgi:hypothetical protein
MSVSEQNSTVFESEVTEEYVAELREQCVPEDELPKVGTIQRWRRSTHYAPRREHEIKISLYLNGEILDFLQSRSDEPLEKQINAELRKIMENEKRHKENLRQELLNDKEFLSELREKLKVA